MQIHYFIFDVKEKQLSWAEALQLLLQSPRMVLTCKNNIRRSGTLATLNQKWKDLKIFGMSSAAKREGFWGRTVPFFFLVVFFISWRGSWESKSSFFFLVNILVGLILFIFDSFKVSVSVELSVPCILRLRHIDATVHNIYWLQMWFGAI